MMRFTIRQQHQINPPETLSLNVMDSDGNYIVPVAETRLLGVTIKRDLTWGQHLKYGNKALIPGLKRKLGALLLVGKYLNKDARFIS